MVILNVVQNFLNFQLSTHHHFPKLVNIQTGCHDFQEIDDYPHDLK